MLSKMQRKDILKYPHRYKPEWKQNLCKFFRKLADSEFLEKHAEDPEKLAKILHSMSLLRAFEWAPDLGIETKRIVDQTLQMDERMTKEITKLAQM